MTRSGPRRRRAGAFAGSKAHMEIVDRASGPRGHVNVAAEVLEAGKVRVQLARPVVLQRGDRLTVEAARP